MCRNILEGGRRCACDSSAARRLRKHNAAARAKYQTEVTPTFVTQEVKNEKVTEEVDAPVAISFEDINVIHNDIDKLNKIYDHRMNYTSEDWEYTLSDGTVYNKENVRNIVMVDEMEKKTTLLGEKITALAESRTGINDAKILETYKSEVAEVQKRFDEIAAEAKAHDQESEKLWPSYINDKGNKIDTFWVMREAQKNGDEAAVTWTEKAKEIADRKTQAWSELAKANSGNAPAINEMLEKNKEEYLNIIKSLRPIGGELKVADNSSKKAVKTLKEALEYYPTSWIEASNSRERAPRIKSTTSRAHYSDSKTQKSYKLVNKMSMIYKPEGWEPNPTKIQEAGVWHKATDGEYKDESNGMSYSFHNEQGQTGWVHEQVEWGHRSWETKTYNKPGGNGWVETQVMDERWNPETGKMEETGMVTQWYRPIKERRLTSWQSQPELTVSGSGNDGKQVALHEFAHRIESTPTVGQKIGALEESFLRRRTTDAEGNRQPMERIYDKKKEFGRPDNFIDKYMGKEYTGSVYREVLSTGAETLWGGSFGSFIGLRNSKADPDMKNFILGLWASA